MAPSVPGVRPGQWKCPGIMRRGISRERGRSCHAALSRMLCRRAFPLLHLLTRIYSNMPSYRG